MAEEASDTVAVALEVAINVTAYVHFDESGLAISITRSHENSWAAAKTWDKGWGTVDAN